MLLEMRPRFSRMAVLWLALLTLTGGCAAAVPQNIEDACAIFEENRDWYRDARDARKRWGVPIEVQLSIIHQESGFRAKAKPPRRRILWVIPGPRPSNAYGYAQALNSTWGEYKSSAGGWGADRDDFGDATDFVGWYTARSARECGIRKDDARSLYLAYHEGNGGYRRGTYRKKKWLISTAAKVAARAQRYRIQLARCEKKLARRRFLWIF
jgi:hypothetical protein